MADNSEPPEKWPRYWEYRSLVLIIVGLLIGAIGVRLLYQAPWAGFGASVYPTVSNQTIVPAKTLWDWLQLLVIPLVLGIGGILFSQADRRSEQAVAERQTEEDRRIADERAQEEALQAYLEQMSTLLLDNGLRTSDPESEVRDVARAWTLTFLLRLKGERKGIPLRFLYESELIPKAKPLVLLGKADLSEADLEFANLVRAGLEEVNLRGANLHGANLAEANVRRVNLHGANLHEANLYGADLRSADLRETNLELANLREANLRLANLRAANLRLARYDDATIWPADFSYRTSGAAGPKADLSGSDLHEADLYEANLRGAALYTADLRGADLRGANLSGANLSGANLLGANLLGADLRRVQFARGRLGRSRPGWSQPEPGQPGRGRPKRGQSDGSQVQQLHAMAKGI